MLAENYQGARVLVVEDDPINQEVARDLLQDVGIFAEVADNGLRAVERVKDADYALVLMDVQMPVMDGLEAIRMIRQIPGKKTLPIVAMTANAYAEDRTRCLEAGMEDHISKPVNPETLYTTLLRWLPAPAQQVAVPKDGDPLANPEKEIRLALSAINGLDVEGGLKRLRGKLSSYRRLLNMFALNHADDVTILRQHLAAGETTDAQRVAHTLKGVAATLGCKALNQRALELEQSLRQDATPAELEGLTNALEAELTPLIAALGTIDLAGDRAESLATTNVDSVEIAVALGQLEALLVEYDTRANEVWRESHTLLASLLGPVAISFGKAIEHYEYEQALQILRVALAVQERN